MERKKEIRRIGDVVEITTSSGTVKGILLESHDPSIMLVKLNSGYNQGVVKKDILDIKVIKKAEK